MDRAEEFDSFVRGSSTSLFRTAVLLVGDVGAAEDLLQTAYERTWRHWRSVAAGDPTAYVRRVLVNAATDSWRRRRRFTALPVRPAVAFQGADALDAADARAPLIEGLRNLPVRQRTAVVLRYWEDMSETATAEVMRCSVGTVKSHASRGLAALRISLGEQQPDPLRDGMASP